MGYEKYKIFTNPLEIVSDHNIWWVPVAAC
jgi:hypothetical protein